MKNIDIDVAKILLAFTVTSVSMLVYGVSIFLNNLWFRNWPWSPLRLNHWIDWKVIKSTIHSIIFLSLLVGFVYTFQTMSVSSCFPIASHGIIFALMEVIGSLANFGQIPLTDKVKLDQNFDSAAWFCTLLNVFVILCFPVIIIITFKMNVEWIQRLDAPRAQAGFQNR